MNKNKISLYLAILININVVIGGGFFFSAGLMAQKGGPLAPLVWIMVGLILFPLVYVLAHLARTYPVAGGIYIYSKKRLSPFWGFVSGWGYFVGTLAGNAVILHEFRKRALDIAGAQFFSQLGMSDLWLDALLIGIFTIINAFNIEFLGATQVMFTVLKTIPLILVPLAGLFLFDPANFTLTQGASIAPLFGTIPFALFAYLGVEATCAIGHAIEDGTKNTYRAIIGSFVIIMAIYSLIQFILIGIHGTGSLYPFIEILPKLTTNPTLVTLGTLLIKSAILSSFLGGFYSMYYTNSWNLYAMAQEKTLHFSGILGTLNRYQSPWACILFQGALIIVFLALFQNVEMLTVMSDFGVVIAYLLSALAFLTFRAELSSQKIFFGVLALGGCLYLLQVLFVDLAAHGLYLVFPYLLFLGVGIISYIFTHQPSVRP